MGNAPALSTFDTTYLCRVSCGSGREGSLGVRQRSARPAQVGRWRRAPLDLAPVHGHACPRERGRRSEPARGASSRGAREGRSGRDCPRPRRRSRLARAARGRRRPLYFGRRAPQRTRTEGHWPPRDWSPERRQRGDLLRDGYADGAHGRKGAPRARRARAGRHRRRAAAVERRRRWSFGPRALLGA